MSKREASQVTTRPAGEAVACRLYRDGDEAALLALLEASFGRWPGVEITVDPIDHLRWKLRSDVCRHHIVAEAGGRTVGMSLLLARPAKVGGRLLVQRMSVDLCVHPDYQRAGVLKAMRDMRHEAFRNVFDFTIGGFSRHPAIVRGRVGQQDRLPIGNRVQVLERPFTLAAALSRLGPQAARGLADGAAGGAMERTSWTVREIDAFDERVDRLWEEASRPFDVILMRDAEFLNWRYCDARAGRFTRLAAEQDGRLLGYAVVQVSHGRGYLSDVLVLPDRLDVLDSLLAHATGYFKDAGVDVAIAWCPTLHPYGAVLGRQGYVVRPRRTRKFAYRPLHRRAKAELLFLQDAQTRLHFTTGDVDAV